MESQAKPRLIVSVSLNIAYLLFIVSVLISVLSGSIFLKDIFNKSTRSVLDLAALIGMGTALILGTAGWLKLGHEGRKLWKPLRWIRWISFAVIAIVIVSSLYNLGILHF